MSLLNRPSDGIYPVLIAIFQLVLARKMDREQLLKLCAPEEACSQDHAGNTLNTWLSLGLFDTKPDGTIVIHADILGAERKAEHLPRVARRLVLDPKNNADLWAKEEARSADFTLALAWFLAQDAWLTEIGGWTEAQEIFRHQLPPDRVLFQNDTRWPSFKEWASYLGFAWTPRMSRGATPDPTEAIRGALPAVFGKHKTLPAKDFIRRLAEEIPVIDGGDYRRQMEAVLLSRDDEYSWKALPEGRLSTSLSRALLRLHEEGLLRYSLKADSIHRVALTGRGGAQIRDDISEFSHHP